MYYGSDKLQGPSCSYTIQFFSPGAAATPSQETATYALRLISIGVNLSCSPWSITPAPTDNITKQERNKITINGEQVVMWDHDISGILITRWVFATFGGHQYFFTLQSQPESATQADLAVFMQMLKGLQYTGK